MSFAIPEKSDQTVPQRKVKKVKKKGDLAFTRNRQKITLFEELDQDGGQVFGQPSADVQILQTWLQYEIITQEEFDLLKPGKWESMSELHRISRVFQKLHVLQPGQLNEFIQSYPAIPDIGNMQAQFINQQKFPNLPWSNCQKEAIQRLTHFLTESQEPHFCLMGFAGTGKTSMLSEMVAFMVRENICSSVAFSAPTNKAVNVIKSKFMPLFTSSEGQEAEAQLDNRVDFLTIHRLLSYKSEFDLEGKRIFVRKNSNKINSYQLVVIDECSMISRDIVDQLLGEQNIKIIFLGDPAQLPPVDENNSSIFGRISQSFLMDEVMRTNKDAIVGICNNIRKWVLDEIRSPQMGLFKGPGAKLYRNKIRTRDIARYAVQIKKSKWFRTFLEQEQAIILTWTNKFCNMYNRIIRETLFGPHAKEYEIGDLLVFNDYYSNGLNKCYPREEEAQRTSELGLAQGAQATKCYTSEQVRVIAAREDFRQFPRFQVTFPEPFKKFRYYGQVDGQVEKLVNDINQATNRMYRVHMLKVRKLEDNMELDVFVLKPQSFHTNQADQEIAQRLIKDLITYFQNFYRPYFQTIEKMAIREIWKSFNLTFIEPFASINYGYSLTTHKSQGSTYPVVYVDSQDILCNPKMTEAKKCIYTAMTRASQELHILV